MQLPMFPLEEANRAALMEGKRVNGSLFSSALHIPKTMNITSSMRNEHFHEHMHLVDIAAFG